MTVAVVHVNRDGLYTLAADHRLTDLDAEGAMLGTYQDIPGCKLTVLAPSAAYAWAGNLAQLARLRVHGLFAHEGTDVLSRATLLYEELEVDDVELLVVHAGGVTTVTYDGVARLLGGPVSAIGSGGESALGWVSGYSRSAPPDQPPYTPDTLRACLQHVARYRCDVSPECDVWVQK